MPSRTINRTTDMTRTTTPGAPPEERDPGTMTADEIRAELDDVAARRVSIENQLDHAKLTGVRPNGERATAQWVATARAALRHTGRREQTLLRALGAARRGRRQNADRAWERTFVRVAKRRLTEKVFDEIRNEVDQEVSGA
jgi:hypothetical protein